MGMEFCIDESEETWALLVRLADRENPGMSAVQSIRRVTGPQGERQLLVAFRSGLGMVS